MQKIYFELEAMDSVFNFVARMPAVPRKGELIEFNADFLCTVIDSLSREDGIAYLADMRFEVTQVRYCQEEESGELWGIDVKAKRAELPSISERMKG